MKTLAGILAYNNNLKLLFMRTSRFLIPVVSMGVCILVFASCQRETACGLPQEQSLAKEIVEQKDVVLSAFYSDNEGDTKTSYESATGHLLWSPSDQISLFYGSGSDGGSCFTSTNVEPVQRTQFSGTIGVITGITEDTEDYYFWGVYPYNTQNSCDGSAITTVVPYEQTGVAESFNDNEFVAIGKSAGLVMGFYNLCGAFYVKVSRSDITAITLRGKDNESIAGLVKVGMGTGVPVVSEVLSGENEVTITMPNGEAFTPGVGYFLVCLPTRFEHGFELVMETSGGLLGVKEYNIDFSLGRNRFQPFNQTIDDGVSFSSDVPSNEIWYTTSNESVLPLDNNLYWWRDLSTFERNHIVSHKYRRGKGVIRFDGPANHIPQYAFRGFSTMTSVKLPSNVQTIQAYAFCGTNISSFALPSSLTLIGAGAFKDIPTMTWVSIPPSVTTVEGLAFKNNGITSAYVYARTLQDYVFEDSSLQSIEIGSTCTSIGTGIFKGCTNLTSIEVAYGNSAYTSSVTNAYQSSNINCIMTTSGSTIIAGGKTPLFNSINSSFAIADEAFSNVGLSGTVSLTYVRSIGTNAFWGNDIRVLYIGYTNTPSTIAISDTAFGNNTNLQSVTFRMNRIPEVGYSIFYNCGNSFTIYVPSNRLSAYQTATNLSQYSSKMVGE